MNRIWLKRYFLFLGFPSVELERKLILCSPRSRMAESEKIHFFLDSGNFGKSWGRNRKRRRISVIFRDSFRFFRSSSWKSGFSFVSFYLCNLCFFCYLKTLKMPKIRIWTNILGFLGFLPQVYGIFFRVIYPSVPLCVFCLVLRRSMFIYYQKK